MTTTSADPKTSIEKSIAEARENVGRRVDEIDRRLRNELDVRKLASEHAPKLMAAGAAAGFLLGYGVPKAILRMLQIGIPIAIAINIARRAAEQSNDEEVG